MSVLGIQGKPILIGGGTDGASVNIAEHSGMKGKLQKQLPWLYWTWCYAHRLELACKDAYSSQLFKDIAEVLLCLYYLYAKSPKKFRELAKIVEDLKEVWELSGSGDLRIGRGNRENHRERLPKLWRPQNLIVVIQSLLKIGMIGLVQALPPPQLWSRAEMQIQTVNQYHHHVTNWLTFTL